MKKILIVGAGAMGAAFSIPLLDNGHSVALTEPYNLKLLEKLNSKKKIHPSLNINLPKKLKIIKFSSDIFNRNWDLIVIAVSSIGIDLIGKNLSKIKNKSPILVLTKGLKLDDRNLISMSSLLRKYNKNLNISVLKGPCLAKELARKVKSFTVVANKKDEKKFIIEGNKRVIEARLADAKFFWDKDRSKNLIKQIANLKSVMFYEKLGTVYDKTQRLRKLAGFLSDDLNISKEKVQVAASISKSDLCSDLVGEYPELQGVMGKYFALAQGFEEDIANSVSDHYLPIGLTSALPKKPFSYSISIVDKIDTLVGFFVINEKPTSSKDPFALRRAAIGLLRIIIENKLSFKLRDLISYAIRLYQEQGVEIKNEKTEQEVLDFIKERMRNVLKLKNIKPDIIEASVSSHAGDNFLDLYAKTILINKYKNKGIGLNAISSYKRASNILDKAGKRITGRPDAVLFRKEEEKVLHEKINEIRKAFTVKDENKDYESLLIKLSDTKESTDNFFDNVVVNDENHDIKNNRLELLKMFCNTFDNFIDFSKLEGL